MSSLCGNTLKKWVMCLFIKIKDLLKCFSKLFDNKGGKESMKDFKQPLSIIFMYSCEDSGKVKPLVDDWYNKFHSDSSKPFSRAVDLPVFIYTSNTKNAPQPIYSLAKKTIVFIFISQDTISNRNWENYIANLKIIENTIYIPIALDKSSLNIRGEIDKTNFIRAYEFPSVNFSDYLFISVAHEIYRHALNKKENTLYGREKALKIFLSHTKYDKIGINLAEKTKDFIDHSQMNRFFDATDIATGYDFDKEILSHIKDSTLLAIHSDEYSSRYWCQLEILEAKKLKRPILAIDCLSNFEDRKFPFSSNIPTIHFHSSDDITEDKILKILSATLLETIRYCYSEEFLLEFADCIEISDEVNIIARPPDLIDIKKIETGKIRILYPDPPVYEEELYIYKQLGYELFTPLTYYDTKSSLNGKKIGLSISELSEEEILKINQNSKHLIILSQYISKYLLAKEATLIYGGDLREGGFTQFIFDEAAAIRTRLKKVEERNIINYIAWPIYKNDSSKIKEWKGKYNCIADMIEVEPADDVLEMIPNIDMFLFPSNKENSFIWSRCLTKMREDMIDNCDIRICAGGKHSGYQGKMPGVLEEILIASEKGKPIYLLGGFGGITASICKIINGDRVEELTEDWQVKHNVGYGDLLNFMKTKDSSKSVNYEEICNKLKEIELNNGLDEDENKRLFETPFIDEAIFLVLKGLESLYLVIKKSKGEK